MTRPPAPIWVLAGLLTLYLAAPFLAGVAQLGAADWRGADLAGIVHAGWISVASASCATALVALGGIPLGYILARVPSRPLAVLGFAVQLPLALPPLASGVLLLFLLGYASPLGRLTQGALTDSFAGIVLAEAFVAAPFLVIAARAAFAGIDPLLEDVAATLGHGPGAVFRHVSLALGWRTILSGLLLAWLRGFGEFGATVMVAYHPTSLPVFTYIAFGSQGLPAMLPVLLPTVGLAIAVMALSEALRPRSRAVAVQAPLPLAPAPRPMPAHRARSLSVNADIRLDGFGLHLDWTTSARRLAILGASGSGKSLTLRLIAGLGDTQGSRVAFDGRDLGRLPAHARGVALMPQDYGLLPNLTVAEQARFAADSDEARALHWIARLGLLGLERRRPRALSLGQQQRVALARALARRSPGLILLDEPFSALDAPLRARMRRELLQVQGELDSTTVLVTHDPVEAMLLADELLLLQDGRVLQAGPVSAVFLRPASADAAALLGAETGGRGVVAAPDRIDLGDGVQLRVGGPRLPVGNIVGFAVRPHQIRLGAGGDMPGRIVARAAVHDGQRQVVVRLGDQTLDVVADPGCPDEGPCMIAIDPWAVQVWLEGEERL